MMQHHKYSLTELENMLPFEREVYLGLLEQHIREENERIERENKTFKALEIAVRERDEYYARACEYLKTIEELEEKIRKYES